MSVMDVNVRKIYSDSYRAYQEWQKLHDMRLFNQRIQAIAQGKQEFVLHVHFADAGIAGAGGEG